MTTNPVSKLYNCRMVAVGIVPTEILQPQRTYDNSKDELPSWLNPPVLCLALSPQAYALIPFTEKTVDGMTFKVHTDDRMHTVFYVRED